MGKTGGSLHTRNFAGRHDDWRRSPTLISTRSLKIRWKMSHVFLKRRKNIRVALSCWVFFERQQPQQQPQPQPRQRPGRGAGDEDLHRPGQGPAQEAQGVAARPTVGPLECWNVIWYDMVIYGDMIYLWIVNCCDICEYHRRYPPRDLFEMWIKSLANRTYEDMEESRFDFFCDKQLRAQPTVSL